MAEVSHVRNAVNSSSIVYFRQYPQHFGKFFLLFQIFILNFRLIIESLDLCLAVKLSSLRRRDRQY